ncbi:MAG TPA: substrate-binding domain-containing protein [Chloroflexota bacterium]|nr:substrate-binding domain-containing protein [Chloroflexota bacterium]
MASPAHPRPWRRIATAAMAAALLGAPVLSQNGPVHAAKSYTFYLSNSFVGNDWRVQMENEARVLAQKPPMSGRVTLKIINTDNTVAAQLASLNNIIQTHPDAILVDASSPDALNSALSRACSQGILVLSFDQVVTDSCAWKLESNWPTMAHALAQWMALTLHGKGNVLIDRGLAGAPISQLLYNAYTSVLGKYPNIHTVGYFNGNYALGPEQSGVAGQLAAHPNVDGILTQGYGTGALAALKNAGHKLVPVTAFSYNGSLVGCQQMGATCILGSNPAWLSGLAMKTALDVLDGKTPNKPRHILLQTPLFANNHVIVPGSPITQIKLGVNAFPKLPAGLTIPFSPPWTSVTPAEATSGKA